MRKAYESEVINITAGDTVTFTKEWSIIQASTEVRVWFGDVNVDIATQGLIFAAEEWIEPLEESVGVVSIYSVSDSIIHIVS